MTIKPLKPKEPPAKPPSLTFSDGLNFGCGFWVAGFLFSIVATPVIVLILSILIGLLGGLSR